MGVTRLLGALALAATFGLAASPAAEAQQTQSRLYEVTKSKKLRVCQFPLYYSISFRNPKTGEIVEEAPGAVFFDAPQTERAKRFLQQFEDE